MVPTAKLKKKGDKLMEKASQMESEICSVLNQQEKMQLWDLEQRLLAQLNKMEQTKTKNDGRFMYREKNFTTAETI